MKISKFILLVVIIVSMLLPYYSENNIILGFAVSDIEIEINLENTQKKHRTFIIDCGNKENLFLTNGTDFSIFREDNQGIVNHIGNLEAVSIGRTTCKAKLKTLSATINERTLGIKNIAIGDIAYPSITLKITDLFKNSNSDKLTKKGKKNISDKILPMINTGEFEKIKIFTFLNRGKSTESEIAHSSILSENIKKNLLIKHGIPEEFIEIHNIANLQNLYGDKSRSKNSRIEFIFVSPEKKENYAIDNTNNEKSIKAEDNDELNLDELDLDEELKEFEMDNKIIKPKEINGPQELKESSLQTPAKSEALPNGEQPGEESLK